MTVIPTFGPPAGRDAVEAPDGAWGVVCRVRGAEVEASVPANLRASAATDAAVAYVKLIAQELARLPHRYGFDPDTAYTVLVQTWDRALVSMPSLAFGRERAAHATVGLIPDAYYIETDGYADLYRFGLRTPRWSRRSSDLVWRGSVTGQGPFDAPQDIPRVKLALTCRAMARTDVALIGVHETMTFPRPSLDAFLEAHSLLGRKWALEDFASHRFTVDIDGHANAWGLLEKLILGCCVLKVESPFEQWFYPRLHAWEHYVPVAADLSDLPDALQWCRNNDANCEWIAANGVRLAATLRLRSELPRSCLEFMKAATATLA